MILIGADFVPTESNAAYFIAGDSEKLFGPTLKKILDDADYRIFNLECPLVDIVNPIIKKGPNLRASTKTVKGYLAAGVDLLTISNNHIMDHGAIGLKSTLQTLGDVGIKSVGAGTSLSEASNSFVFTVKDKKIGVYACAEHEFSIAKETTCGVNPFDPLETPDHITALKEAVDFVIVLYHGGKEYYRYPSPNLQKRCRKMISKGADLIICQHNHCIGCYEKYRSGTVVYGQGNFLFDHGDNEYWNTSILVSILENFEIKFIPLTKNSEVVRMAQKDQAKEILASFEQRSKEIQVPGFVQKKYEEYAECCFNRYILELNGRGSKLFRFLNRLSDNKLRKLTIEKRFGRTQLLALKNDLDCEAHAELLSCGIDRKLEQMK